MKTKPSEFIEALMRRTACDHATAVAYLEAEEWNLEEAECSLLGDRQFN